MKRFACLVVSVAAAVFAGCATPSVHPIYTDDTLVDDPSVVGTWKDAESNETYTVTRAERGYHLLVKNNDKDDPEQWEFAVRLTQIGDHRFADFSAPAKDRDGVEEKWGPLFVPTHMFGRYSVGEAGDTLELRLLNRAWLKKAMADPSVTLDGTPLDGDVTLITSQTPALRAFLEKFGGDSAAFADTCRLIRVKP